MRVATWNVRHGRPRRGFTSNRRLAASAHALDVDVLAVQEVERHVVRSWFADQPALLSDALDADSRAYAPARSLAIIGSDGIALCVRGEMARQESIELPHAAGQPRVALLAEIEIADLSLTVVTTHLQNEEHEARRQLTWLLDRLASATRPCVLLGDLNLRPHDIEEMISAAGFQLGGGGPTEPADAPVQRIDHIVVDGFEIESVTVGVAEVSDHLPLIAELR